jgi:hypothetical protein
MRPIRLRDVASLLIVVLLFAFSISAEGDHRSSIAQALPLNGLYTIIQLHTGRFLDAHVTADRDFRVVTRPRQDNASQRWQLTHLGGSVYTIEQQSTGRRLDAHDTHDRDFAVVTRPRQNNTTQQWLVTALGSDRYEILQRSTGRNLDAHDTQDKDFAVVTRPVQNNNTQRWIVARTQ